MLAVYRLLLKTEEVVDIIEICHQFDFILKAMGGTEAFFDKLIQNILPKKECSSCIMLLADTCCLVLGCCCSFCVLKS